jgi:hypothetical protein
MWKSGGRGGFHQPTLPATHLWMGSSPEKITAGHAVLALEARALLCPTDIARGTLTAL